MTEKLVLSRLRELYASDKAAKAVLDSFAGRQRNYKETKVDRLYAVVSDLGESISWGDIVRALKSLQELGFCEYVVGRHGYPSRVEWKVGIVSLGQAAAGLHNDIEAAPQDVDLDVESAPAAEITPHDMMKIGYPLRAELTVQMSLPKNLTRREAERLSEFIKTLPFEQ
jgi:hypothetical protein